MARLAKPPRGLERVAGGTDFVGKSCSDPPLGASPRIHPSAITAPGFLTLGCVQWGSPKARRGSGRAFETASSAWWKRGGSDGERSISGDAPGAGLHDDPWTTCVFLSDRSRPLGGLCRAGHGRYHCPRVSVPPRPFASPSAGAKFGSSNFGSLDVAPASRDCEMRSRRTGAAGASHDVLGNFLRSPGVGVPPWGNR